jgi:Chalcone isomerase-like
MRRLAVLALAAALAAPASAVDVQGFKVPDAITVGGKELRHNGSGIRRRFVVKVYVGSLFLEAPSSNAEEIVAADRPKSVQLRFLRDVSKEKMLDAFRDGFRNNSPAEAEKLAAKLDRLSRALPAEMKEKSLLEISYVPGKGSVVHAQGGSEVTIEGKEFADALFRNWLGPHPADDGLKKRMLGG